MESNLNENELYLLKISKRLEQELKGIKYTIKESSERLKCCLEPRK